MTRHSGRVGRGFTLLETLLALALISILGGIFYLALAPARERAREMHCISNFRQISQAIQMYRQDYGGSEVAGGRTLAELGLPPSSGPLRRKYAREPHLWKCPSEYWGSGEPGPSKFRPVSYMWMINPDEKIRPPIPPFSERVTRRGEDTPLLGDPHHGNKFRGTPDPLVEVVVLRLSGQVQRLKVDRRAPSWEW